MLYENGQYTEKIHSMTADQVWKAWKNQKLNVGQVSDWQNRHNFFFNISTADHEPTHNYSIVLNTENEKYSYMRLVRAAGGKITDVSGYYDKYHLCFNATASQAEMIDNTWR